MYRMLSCMVFLRRKFICDNHWAIEILIILLSFANLMRLCMDSSKHPMPGMLASATNLNNLVLCHPKGIPHYSIITRVVTLCLS
jgi:hypothetical protein